MSSTMNVFNSHSILNDNVAKGLKELDEHPQVSLFTYGGLTVSFTTRNNPFVMEEVIEYLEEQGVRVYRANKSPEEVEDIVDELIDRYGDEVTDEWGDRDKIIKNVKGPASLQQRGNRTRGWFFAFYPDLLAANLDA